jgi:hypothetical protein
MKQAARIGSFFAFPIFVFSAHLIVARGLHLYRIFPNIDIPFHYIGGLSIAYASSQVLAYLEAQKIISTLNKMIFLALILSLTATAAVFWEFLEFTLDQFLATHLQPSLANTMQDQFLGVLGGSTWAIICYRRDVKRLKS